MNRPFPIPAPPPPALRVAIASLVAIGLVAAAGRALALAGGGASFVPFGSALPAAVLEDARILDRWFAGHAALTWAHIVSGGLFLALAPFQFAGNLRERRPRLHRAAGRALLFIALPAGLTGVLLQAASGHGGLMADVAVFAAGALFLGALLLAYRAIRRRDFVRHREWMIRLLAIGLAAGAVRLVSVPLVLLTGRRPLELVAWGFWIGFALPIAGGEAWIRSSRRDGATVGPMGRELSRRS